MKRALGYSREDANETLSEYNRIKAEFGALCDRTPESLTLDEKNNVERVRGITLFGFKFIIQ